MNLAGCNRKQLFQIPMSHWQETCQYILPNRFGRGCGYKPSVNSRPGCSRFALQTQDLGAPKPDFLGKWGGTLGGLPEIPR
jgi:hypothetical protein